MRHPFSQRSAIAVKKDAFQIVAGGWRHPPVASATGRCLIDRKIMQGTTIGNALVKNYVEVLEIK